MKYRNILMIDDDHDDFFIFSTSVKSISEDIRIFHELNGKEALIKLDDNTLQPDIIFLDLNMPIMSGQEFLMKYNNHSSLKKVPVIVYSTSISPATTECMKQLGALESISKPERIENIQKELKRVLGISG